MEHKIYDPNFGDQRMCKCGHQYYYHFNRETGKTWGCIYSYNCGCKGFEEQVELQQAYKIKVKEEDVRELLLDIFHIDDWQGSEPYYILKKWLEDAGIKVLKKGT